MHTIWSTRADAWQKQWATSSASSEPSVSKRASRQDDCYPSMSFDPLWSRIASLCTCHGDIPNMECTWMRLATDLPCYIGIFVISENLILHLQVSMPQDNFWTCNNNFRACQNKLFSSWTECLAKFHLSRSFRWEAGRGGELAGQVYFFHVLLTGCLDGWLAVSLGSCGQLDFETLFFDFALWAVLIIQVIKAIRQTVTYIFMYISPFALLLKYKTLEEEAQILFDQRVSAN